MIRKCKGHKRYKAVRRPSCGCLWCWIKYIFRRQKPAPRKVPTTTQLFLSRRPLTKIKD